MKVSLDLLLEISLHFILAISLDLLLEVPLDLLSEEPFLFIPTYSQELDVKAVFFSYFRNLKSTVRNGKTENDFLEVTLAAEDGNFC